MLSSHVSPILVHTLQQLSDSGEYVYDLQSMDAWYEAIGETGADDPRHVSTVELINAVFDDEVATVKHLCKQKVDKPLLNCEVANGKATLLGGVVAKEDMGQQDLDMVKILLDAGADPNLKTDSDIAPFHINIQKQTIVMIEDFFWREKINIALLSHDAKVHTSDVILGLRKAIFPSLSQVEYSDHIDLLVDSCVFGLATLAKHGPHIRDKFPQFYDLVVRYGNYMTLSLCHILEDHATDVCPSIIELTMLSEEILGYLGETIDTVMIRLLSHCKKLLTMHYTTIGRACPMSLVESTVYAGHLSWFIWITAKIQDDHEQGDEYLAFYQNPVTGATLPTCILLSPLDFNTKSQMLLHLRVNLDIFMHGKDRLSMTPLMHACAMKTIIGVNHPLDFMKFFLECDTGLHHHCGFSNGMAVSPMSIVLETTQFCGDIIDKIMVLDEHNMSYIQNKDYFLTTAVHRSLYTRDWGMLEVLADMFEFNDPKNPRLYSIMGGCLKNLDLFPDGDLIKRFLKRMGLELKCDATPKEERTYGRPPTIVI